MAASTNIPGRKVPWGRPCRFPGGTLQQYVGRLHRLHDNKREVIVYDYVDGCVPVLSAIYSRRLRGYEAVGYEIQEEIGG